MAGVDGVTVFWCIVKVVKWNRMKPHPDVEEEPFETRFEGKDFGVR